ncbi:MAG TPA: hypothetical protein VJ799_09225 [Nitrososphaeraceae archaeon]|nr:hypothetical protein [Nitrososphaeraceae archaeon]
MSQTKIWMALALIGGLFLVIGAQTSVSAQMANDTSAAMGAAAENATNATSWSANATNATSMDNGTGNISGLLPP